MINFLNSLGSQALLDILLLSKDPTAIYTGEELTIQLVNDAMLAIWGKNRSVRGMRFEDALPEMEGQPYTELLKNVWKSGNSFEAKDMAATMQIGDKAVTSYFDFIYRALTDENGRTYAILHTATDVTDRIAAWKKVEENEIRLQQINEELAVLNEEYMATNEELHATNEQVAALNEEYQATNEELHATNEELASLNEEYQATNEELHTVNEQLGALNEEYQATNEELNMANEKLGRLNNEHQMVNETLSKLNDELEQANREINLSKKTIGESNDRLKLAILAGQMGSYDLDLATGLMECSDQCKENFGRSSSERFDLPDLFAAILPEHLENVQNLINESIATDTIYEANYQIRLNNGTLRWINASGSPRYDDQGKAVRIVGITQDVTDKKAYEQRREEFLTIASHELKTPITVLKANLQLLQRIKDQLSHPTAGKLIDTAWRSLEKFTAMIDELLDVSRHQQGKLELNRQEFDLLELLENCCGHVRLEGTHQLVINAPHFIINADENRIEQVLVNLVNNAVKYASEGPQIFLGAEVLENEVRVSVRDTGKGIPPEQLPHMFDRFWQAETKDNGYTGLGLGLFICSEIIKRHGGKIWAESEIGTGTTFYFTLPINPQL